MKKGKALECVIKETYININTVDTRKRISYTTSLNFFAEKRQVSVL